MLQHDPESLSLICNLSDGVMQLGFFNIVGIPLFKAMADLFEESQPMLDGVLGNFRLWEAMAAEAAAT